MHLDGHPQSYVDLADPELLAFEYVQHLAACLDVLEPGAPQRLAVTHVGGAALTLPRYVEQTRPRSPQIVLEPDADLTAAVRERLPLPRGHRIRVRPQAGRAGLAELADGSADAVVLDAFAAGRVPADLTTQEALAQCARILHPTGVWLANLPDEPGRRYVARVAAAAEHAGLHRQLYVATLDVHKGRGFGNTVLVASAAPLPVAALQRALARSPFPTGVADEVQSARHRLGARPATDADPALSPAPPDPGRWRAR